MPCVQSARPRAELSPFVRAYAQRTVDLTDSPWTQSVPAQLEQILNLELGVLPLIRHRDRDVSREILIGGAQDGFSGTLHLLPGVVSFAVFFWPSGWSQLFNKPVKEITDQFVDATLLHGSSIRDRLTRFEWFTSILCLAANVEKTMKSRYCTCHNLHSLLLIVSYITF